MFIIIYQIQVKDFSAWPVGEIITRIICGRNLTDYFSFCFFFPPSQGKTPEKLTLFNHEEYERQEKQFPRRDLQLEGIYEEEEEEDDYDADDDTDRIDEIGYFYDSESSDDPFLRTPIRTPLDDYIDQVKLESDRSNTQDPPKCGSVSSWRKRLPPN